MKKITVLVLCLTTLLISEELKVKANQFSTDETTGITIFSGSVNIIKNSDEINASKITIFTNSKREPIRYIADGNVSFYIKTENSELYRGKSNKVIYLPIENEYHFFHNVHLEQIDSKKVIIGEEVVLKTLEGKAYAKGAKKEPVIMIFNMPKKEEKK